MQNPDTDTHSKATTEPVKLPTKPPVKRVTKTPAKQSTSKDIPKAKGAVSMHAKPAKSDSTAKNA